ncbi:MAG: hypothetical protein H3C64_13150 [Candidatus Kuenenia stuttgartiensis]|nr:hypothetical protein [Candidatus Kuenenia stuttgartiensis]
MFLDVLQAVVFSCVVPLMYVIILVFAFLLIRRAPTMELRIRSLVGVLGGILLALAFVIVDVTATGFAESSVDPTNVFIVVPFGIVSAIVGFFILFAIDIFLRRGAAAFVVFFIVWVSLVSAYFLIRASELRSIISLSTVTFLLGNVVYVLMNFSFVKRFFGLASSAEDKTDNQRWKL